VLENGDAPDELSSYGNFMQKENSSNIFPEYFSSARDLQDFWDTHSASDYWDQMETVDMQLSPRLRERIQTRKLYSILNLSTDQISALEQYATNEQVEARTIIADWVQERIRAYAH
jgi:hypothetical protein